MQEAAPNGTLGRVAKQTFGRINSTVSITVASHVSALLAMSLPHNLLILVSVTFFVLLVSFNQGGSKGLMAAALRPVTTAKSVMGIVVTTTIMRTISDAAAPGRYSAGSGGAWISGNYSLLSPAILATCFVLATGSLPDWFKESPEGSAMYVPTLLISATTLFHYPNISHQTFPST